MINKLLNILQEVKASVTKNDTDDSLEKIVVFSDYDRKMNELLIEREHNRMVNIHNLAAYFDLVAVNDKYFEELNNYLVNNYGREYQKEVLKEIALNIILRKYTLREICELYQKHENQDKRNKL